MDVDDGPLRPVVAYNRAMRWNGLFADLEAQVEALERQERAGEIDERVRAETGRTTLSARLRGSRAPVRCELLGGQQVAGSITRAGADWVLMAGDDGTETVLVCGAVRAVHGLARHGVAEALGPIDSRMGLTSVLRAIARDRAPVSVYFVDGTVVAATIDRVGADFVEAAVHAVGEPRRRTEVREILALSTAAVAAVRRAR